MAKVTTSTLGDLAILPYQAQAPLTEALEFLTDVMEAYDGSEQRLQLRTMPRQTFQYTIPVKFWNIAESFNTAYNAIRKKWAIPLWTEAQFVGDVTAHATDITCNTSLYDLRASSLAFLFNAAGAWQVVEISTKTSTKINVTNDLSYIASAWLMPIRIGWIVGDVKKSTNAYEDMVEINFFVDDNLDLTPSAPTQYLSNDIYFDSPVLSGSNMDKSLQQRADIVDQVLGVVSRRSPWLNARYASTYRSVLQGAQQVRDYKAFLYRRAGKFRSFWMPTFEQNMRHANTGTILSTLTIEADSYAQYPQRQHIAIESASGVWYPRAVSNPTPVAGNRIQLTLDSALNLDASKVRRISYLGLHRLNTDKIELRWIGNNVVESEFGILEISP